MTDDIVGALRAVLGPDIGIGFTDPREKTADLWPQEQAAIVRAIPKRQHEFAAGRRAARQAMAELGLPPAEIAAGQDRAPIWPAGLTGSIAHCETHCIAVLSQTHRSIGIDIEPGLPLDADLIPIVCTAQELLWLHDYPAHERGLVAKRIFCAKEAVYKAQYPVIGQVIGFDALIVRLNRDDTFDVIWLQAIPNLPAMQGTVCRKHDMIVACAAF